MTQTAGRIQKVEPPNTALTLGHSEEPFVKESRIWDFSRGLGKSNHDPTLVALKYLPRKGFP